MNLLRNLNLYKCMGPGGKHPGMLADVIVISHTVISERSWISKKNPDDLRKANVPPVFKR